VVARAREDGAVLRGDVRGERPRVRGRLDRLLEDEALAGGGGDADRQRQAAARAAVRLADDDVLRDVDEATREVTGVRGAQRRVREALAGTVGGDEVLEDGQALAVVRLDGARDDLALR